MHRAIGKGASVFHRSERILGTAVEIGFAVIRRRFRGRRPLANVKFASFVLSLFGMRDCVQTCGAGWCNGEDELRLRTSLVRRANGRSEEWKSVVCGTQI